MGWLIPIAVAAVIALAVVLNAPDWIMASVIVASAVATIYMFTMSGYPLLPTVAWSVPVGVILLAGLALHGWIGILGFVGIVSWTAMWLLESAREFWYETLFKWRPPSPDEPPTR